MEIDFPISKDEDGFIWRQCPTCEAKFKWHEGPLPGYEVSESSSVYYCPICGHSADVSAWFTHEQLETAESAAAPQITQLLEDELSRIGGNRRNAMIKIDWNIDRPDVSPTELELHEDHFCIIASPCHPDEPVKVATSESTSFYCLVCGSRFAV